MREYSVPALYEVPPDGNLTDPIVANGSEAPDAPVLTRRVDGAWQDVTARQFLDDVTAVAKGLIAAGIRVGDRVALMSRTRYEWTLADFAIWMAGGVTVPVYETSSVEQTLWILDDSGAVACFIENDGHADTIAKARAEAPGLAHVWEFEADDLAVLREQGRAVADAEVQRRRAELGPDTLATIIYTSGTTGRPKGVQLTHGNFLRTVGNGIALLPGVFREDGSSLLFLPMAHVFARIIEIGAHMARTRVGFIPDTRTLLPDLATFRPTYLVVAPRVLEKVYNGARLKADSEGRGKIFDAAASAAVAYSQALDAGGPSLALRVKHAVYDKLVYQKLRAALGGRCEFVICGSAPLGERLGHFFRGVGQPVYEGYGLTETTAAMTVSTPAHHRIGTVGRPVPGGAVAVADDGEILLKGVQIFTGYWHNEAATAETLKDGWFRTGDLGSLDDDGFVRITGRKKELIVTAGGKNVAPAVIEDRIRLHPIISQVVVVGDQRPFIGALITLDEEYLAAWKAKHGKPAEASVAELSADPDLLAEVQAAVDDGNAAVSRAEAVRKFRILPVELTEGTGHVTASMKLKRHVVIKDYADEIEKLYA